MPAATFGLLFFFGRSTNVHCLPWDEHSWHGGDRSILHATWRARQKSQGRYLRDLYERGPGCTEVKAVVGVSSRSVKKSVGDSDDCENAWC